uniref:T-cell differentiation antigen CD6 n=1 Tax=Oryctolagus cuniculus TaxID=9986 RepID=A0A5F9DCB9_RABIT
MAPDIRLLVVMAGLLRAAFPGPFTAPSGQPDASHTQSKLSEPGLRLVSGSSRCSGTVEVWFGEAWKAACGALWDGRAAEAACRVLGCGGAEAAVQPAPSSPTLPPRPAAGNSSQTANATLPVVQCSGAEWRLCEVVSQACSSDGRPAQVTCAGTEHPCSLGFSLGSPSRLSTLPCPLPQGKHRWCPRRRAFPAPPTTLPPDPQAPAPPPHKVLPPPEHRALRLVDGGSPCAGRVEMLEYGRWGSVCDDTWDLEDAHVVCRQLGCGWAVQALPGLHFAPGQGPIHRDQVNCSGDETYLWDCPGTPGEHYCGHKEDAGVVCSEHQSWRLTGGADRCEGQVEVHFRGVWSTVCDSEWYSPEASVLCRALGCGTLVDRPRGLPHSLSGRMYYSCEGGEPTLSNCSWRFNNSNLCSQSHAARVLCSGSRSLHNLSTPEVPASVQPASVEPSVTVKMEDKESQELALLIPCIVLGVLLLASLISIAFILFRIKGKYALPVTMNHQHLPTTIPAGTNSYKAVPITIPKEEVPKLPIQVRAQPAEDSDSSSDSDYEHYDFSAQPPVALTTFYNSQRHRVTEDEAQQRRFQMPPLEEGLEELHTSPILAANPIADAPSLGPQHQHRSQSESSTSSGEDYCNSPSSKPPAWSLQGFPSERSPLLEQPPNLELAGPQAACPGKPCNPETSPAPS